MRDALTYSWSQFVPGETFDCFVRSVKVTVLAVPADGESTTSWSGSHYCAPGGAGFASCDFMRGLRLSRMFITCIVGCAATWTCSVFPASTAREPSPGCSVCFVFPRTGALPAETVFSQFVCIDALCPRCSLRRPGWSRSPYINREFAPAHDHGYEWIEFLNFCWPERIMMV